MGRQGDVTRRTRKNSSGCNNQDEFGAGAVERRDRKVGPFQLVVWRGVERGFHAEGLPS